MKPQARMRSSMLGAWRQARPWQRFGYLVGGALVLVGLAHLAAWLLVGGAWAGPVSFRKPSTFGITTMTLAWVAGHLRISDRTGWLLLARPSTALAIRAGLLILLVAQGVGGWMIQHGVGPAEEGVTQGLTTFGAAFLAALLALRNPAPAAA
jgi:hypothetical protein